MEVFLLLWDEIDDLLAPARLLFTGYAARPAPIDAPAPAPDARPLLSNP